LLFQYLLISPISKNVFAAGIAPTVHVSSESISDDEALCKVNLEPCSRSKANNLPDVNQANRFVFEHRARRLPFSGATALTTRNPFTMTG
jgi:hypothetical protein